MRLIQLFLIGAVCAAIPMAVYLWWVLPTTFLTGAMVASVSARGVIAWSISFGAVYALTHYQRNMSLFTHIVAFGLGLAATSSWMVFDNHGSLSWSHALILGAISAVSSVAAWFVAKLFKVQTLR